MQNLLTLITILSPLFIGFCIPLPGRVLVLVDKSLNGLVYIILFLIGVGLAQVEHLAAQLGNIGYAVLLLFICTIGMNLLALMLFDRFYPWQQAHQGRGKARISLNGSFQQLASVLAGVILGFILPPDHLPPAQLGTYALMLLIFLVALQLRGNRITLRQVLLNRRGMQTALVCTVSALLGGLLFALFMEDVAWNKGLALASGFGWYSLSAIVISEAYGPLWGSVALLNDLLREFFALACIPLLMVRHPSAAVASGGATSIDFTLPVIQASGGLAVVPLAISCGFILNVLPPVLMVAFSALG